MSHFYGTLEGKAKTRATRCGTKNSGITVQAAGWNGAIKVRVWHDDENDVDYYEVVKIPWQQSGGRPLTLASGHLDSTQDIRHT